MEIKTPDLGVESAEVSEILVSLGDSITEDDNIVLLESDKAAVEVPSTSSGTVSKILVTEGDTVSEGTVLIEIEEESNSEHQDNLDKNADKDNTSEKSTDKTDLSQNVENQFNTGSESQSHKEVNSEKKEDDLETVSNNTPVNNNNNTYALPDLGVEEAEVAECLVNVGDEIEEDQPLLLIESDKASVEVPSPVTGIVEELLVKAGDKVTNGQDYIVIKSSANPKNNTSTKQDTANNQRSTKDSHSNDGENLKVTGSDSKVKDDRQKSGTNSTNARQQAQSEDTNLLPSHQTPSNNQNKAHSAQDNKLSESQVNKKLSEVYAGPAVRKLSRQLGLDITKIEGSGPKQRLLKEDLFDFVKSHMQNQHKIDEGTVKFAGLPSLPDMTKSEIWGEIETHDLSRLQKVSIPQLTYNTYLPQVTQFDLSDITETESLRKALKPEFKNEGIGLTILAFIVKATAYALMQNPKFNSHLSNDNTQIHIRKTVNMGIAVATDNGLIVPVIKHAQQKGIKQIAIEIGELAEKARDKKLTTKELQGASFTISSQGNLGGTYFTPLVNWPQVGILGISEATMQPKWNTENQSFEPRLMLPLSLSYDHRVINGADAAIFTRYIANLLSDPRRILL